MNNAHNNDTIEELLVRSGDYLMERTAQYREQPVRTELPIRTSSSRRRVLVGTAAAATLCVTALAGSFIGGSSTGKIHIAKAAWSAIPATPTAEQVKKVQLDCHLTKANIATIESVPPASIPNYMAKPALVDVRGTTTTGVFLSWTQMILCAQFADGSINVNVLPMVQPNESAWQKPAAIEFKIEDVPATLVVGFLPPNMTKSDSNSTSETDTNSGSQWEAYIEAPGVERTKASVSSSLKRFVAWVPVVGNFTVKYVNTVTGEERDVQNVSGFIEGPLTVSPVTTVAVISHD